MGRARGDDLKKQSERAQCEFTVDVKRYHTLVVLSDIRNVAHDGDAKLSEKVLVSNTGSFEDRWGTKSTSRNHYHPVRHDCASCCGVDPACRHHSRRVNIFDAVGPFVVVEQYAGNLAFDKEMQVGVAAGLHERVNVAMGCILTDTVWRNVLGPFL
jgi:hypothetical protein